MLHSAAEPQQYDFDDIIGVSPQIAELKRWGETAAESPSTVLIRGESGTGKELFAQAIHNGSDRRRRRFIALNCAAMPETLIESELFGHDEGAFTGAKKGGLPGKFEMAHGGTIFLDEIGEMPLQVQTKLLRVLQEKKVSRIGSAIERTVDIRVIAATNRDLLEEVRLGRFRLDLYYRLNVLELTIPPLRERREDIVPLALHLMLKVASKFNRAAYQLSDDFLEKLQGYDWPGNVRELENCIERAIARAAGTSVLTADLLDIAKQEVAPAAPPRRAVAEVRSLREVERDTIAEALMLCEGNIQKTSAKLGIGRNTLYRKMKEFGLS